MRIWLMAATGFAVLGGFVIAWQIPNGPLLGWWLTWALALGAAIAIWPNPGDTSRGLKALLILHGVLVAAGLLSTHFAARRLTSATHLRYEGVHFERMDSILVGSGGEGMDVVLPTLVSGQTPWHLALTRGSSGWNFAPRAAVEQVRIESAGGEGEVGWIGKMVTFPLRFLDRSESYQVMNGLVLDGPGSSVVIRDHRGLVLDTLRMEEEGGVVLLRRGDGGVYRFEPGDDRLDHRYDRMLRFGTSIGSFEGPRSGLALYDRFVRIQRIPSGHSINGDASGWGDWLGGVFGSPSKFLVTASAPFGVSDGLGDGPDTGAIPLQDSTRVHVRHAGTRWTFDLIERRREPTAEMGLTVRFVQNPRPLDSPLPGSGSCAEGAACGLLSNRVLPAPIAHISLARAGAGFEAERFGLLARLEEAEGGVRVILPTDTTWIPRSSGASRDFEAIPVTPRVEGATPGTVEDLARGPGRWVILSASGNRADELPALLLISLGIASLMFWLGGAVRIGASSGLAWRNGSARAVTLGVNAVLTLLLARLVVGGRVTFFEPFEPRGLETAVGMWIAAAVVAVGLLRWDVWAPYILKAIREVCLSGPGRIRRSVEVLFNGRSWRRVPVAPSLAFALALGSLGAGAGSLRPLALGLLAGAGVLLAWFTIAWVEAFAGTGFATFDTNGPWEVIEHETERPGVGGRLARVLPDWPLMVLPLVWALCAWKAWPGFFLAVVGVVPLLWWCHRQNPEAWTPHRTIPLGGAYLGSALLPAFLRSQSANGALAAFLFVILVALVGIRSGRMLATRLKSRGSEAGRPGGWEVVTSLGFPVFLLFFLAAIDMGLLLVMLIPIGAASALTVGFRRLGGRWALLSATFAIAVIVLLGRQVLRPDLSDLRSDDPIERAERFERMPEVFGVRVPLLSPALERASARAVAALDQQAAEELLLSARPGLGRDLIIPSIEQAWGGRAYAAAGWGGVGLGAAPIGRGVAEAVSYAENSYSVYILHEHGVFGGFAVLCAYLMFLGAVGSLIWRNSRRTPSGRASEALFLVAAIMVAFPAAYVALSNLGIVPITGQNMPFLGLNAWSDVALCAGVLGILVTGAMRMAAQAGPGAEVVVHGSGGGSSGGSPDREWRRVVREKAFQLTLLVIAGTALVGAGFATWRVGASDARSADLRYDGVKNQIRALMANRGPEGVATYHRADIPWGDEFIPVDTLAATGDSLLFSSLAVGGFLRDHLEAFNGFSTRNAILGALEGREAIDSSTDPPSLFRLARSDSAYFRLSRGLNEYALSAASPFAERAWREVRTADWRDGTAVMGLFGDARLILGDTAPSAPVELNGRACHISRRDSVEHLLYCTSTAGLGVGAAFDLSMALRSPSTARGGARIDLSRPERVWVNGLNAQTPALIQAGDLLHTVPVGPLSLSDVRSGLLASRQWVNGRETFTIAAEGTLGFFGRAGRAVTPGSEPLTLSFDQRLASALQNEVDQFATANVNYLERMSIVVADLRTGEVRAVVEAGGHEGRALLAFEPELVGSMVKPILAAAILSQDPELADLQVDWAGPAVSEVSGISVGSPFASPLNGCGTRIDLDAYLRCSINQYSVELLFRSMQRRAGRQDIAADGVVATSVLSESPLVDGLFSLFGDDVLDVVQRPLPIQTGRTDWYWRIHPGEELGVRPAATDSLRDRTLYPFASRPWLIRADEPGTSTGRLARFAFGAWENRWTLMGVAEAYARIATGRRVGLSFLERPDDLGEFQAFDSTASEALGHVRRALRAVGETGTASGLAPLMESVAGTDARVALLSKTGTLNEITERVRDDDVYVKALAMTVGRPADEDRTAPLECGLVAITYFEFRQDWRRAADVGSGARLPDLHREFAEARFAEVLRGEWGRMEVCGG